MDPDHDADELVILSGRGRLVETNTLPRSPQDSPVRSSTATTRRTGTAYSQPNSDAYDVVHPMLLNNLREATQQQGAAQANELLWNNARLWEGAGIYDTPTSAVLQTGTSRSPVNIWL